VIVYQPVGSVSRLAFGRKRRDLLLKECVDALVIGCFFCSGFGSVGGFGGRERREQREEQRQQGRRGASWLIVASRWWVVRVCVCACGGGAKGQRYAKQRQELRRYPAEKSNSVECVFGRKKIPLSESRRRIAEQGCTGPGIGQREPRVFEPAIFLVGPDGRSQPESV